MGSKDRALDDLFNEKTEYEPETMYGPAPPPGFNEYEPEPLLGPALPPNFGQDLGSDFVGPALPPSFFESDISTTKPSIYNLFGDDYFPGGAW